MFFPKKKVIVTLVLAIPLMAMMPWKVKKLRSYFPLTKGSGWQYNVFSRTDNQLTTQDSIYCNGDTMINNSRYMTIAGKKSERIFPAGYWRFEKTKLFRYNTNTKRDVVFADFSKRKGEEVIYTSDTLVYNARVLSTDTTYAAPYPWKVNSSDEPILPRTFTHTYCVEWTVSNSHDTVILFFQQGTGLVGVKMAGGEELYLNSEVVKRR
jgi:hypothetical protein